MGLCALRSCCLHDSSCITSPPVASPLAFSPGERLLIDLRHLDLSSCLAKSEGGRGVDVYDVYDVPDKSRRVHRADSHEFAAETAEEQLEDLAAKLITHEFPRTPGG